MAQAKRKKATAKTPGTSLARPGDPLVAANGQVVEPENKPPPRGKAALLQPQLIDPAQYRPSRRRALKELPAAPNVINGVGAVFMYTLLGVGDREIADTLRVAVQDVEDLRNHSAYGECFQIVHGEFINANSDLLTSRIAAYSQTALTTVGTLASDSKKEEVKLRASIDLLDRAGVRPKDQEGKAQATRNDLRIIVVDGNKSDNVEIDITGEQ